jgi:hypothetical protein
MSQPNSDRYRDKEGPIAERHGDTLISSLRLIYGAEFAANIPGIFKLEEVLPMLDDKSLNQLILNEADSFVPLDGAQMSLKGSETHGQGAIDL